jgi:hypothetical protein
MYIVPTTRLTSRCNLAYFELSLWANSVLIMFNEDCVTGYAVRTLSNGILGMVGASTD